MNNYREVKKRLELESKLPSNEYYQMITKPIHQNKDSLFNSSSGHTNYRGLVNLCYIILVLSNFRVALENILKYGILVDTLTWTINFFSIPNIQSMLVLFLLGNAFILISFLTELFLIRHRISNRHLLYFFIIHLISLLATPLLIFNYYVFNPIAASICCGSYCIIFLKLVSYHMVNYWHREKLIVAKDNDEVENNNVSTGNGSASPIILSSSALAPMIPVSYPDNLTLFDLYYFIIAPTLCYELNFPRRDRIRKSFLIKRILEIILLVQVEIGLIQQWLVPGIQNSVEPFMEMSFSKMLERLLKLAVPNHLVWLIFFYLYFHSWMNLIAELIRFADREFYKDWWNSESVNYFWRTWNIPVYRWSVRHVYLPLLSNNVNHLLAVMIVFSISALFHEYLISVPLNMYRVWIFTGMVLQFPLAYLVKKLPKNFANYAVWLILIIGQPLCILMYYHDFYVIHFLKPKQS